MNGKKWCISFLLTYGIVIFAIAAFVAIVDPYFHYHKPIEGFSYLEDKGDYINDGISKNFTYNAMITGTSMTMGFDVKEADRIFGKDFVKVYFLGEGFKRINDNLISAIQHNPDLKFVIRGVDTLWFVTEENELGRDEYPEYLYDDQIWNDVYYLLNGDVLFDDAIPVIVRTIKEGMQTQTVLQDENIQPETNAENESADHDETIKYDRPPKDIKVVEAEETAEFFDILDRNLEKNVISTIRENPDITFYIFFPPYSICWWDSLNQSGTEVLKRRIDMEQYAIEKLLEYENVHLFSFFNNFELICDFNNYGDEIHYSDQVSSQILTWMAEGEYELTEDNYLDYIDEITEFYCNYDYDAIFE